MQKLKYAIIGFGNAGQVHAKVLSRVKNVNLVAVCDIDEERRELARKKYSVRTYGDFKDMAKKEKIGAVSICLPHYLHASVSVFMEVRGINVLCEKPLAISVTDAEKMIRVARKHGVILGSIFQHRFEPINVLIKKEVDRGKLGKIISTSVNVKWRKTREYYSNWQGDRKQAGAGVLINQAIHFIDLAQWFNGGVRSVIGKIKTNRNYIDVEDNAIALIFYKNGSFGVFDCSTSANPFLGSTIEIVGSVNSIKMHDGYVVAWGGKSKSEVDEINDSIREVDKETWGKNYFGYGHIFQIKNFVKSVIKGKRPAVIGEDGLDAVKLVLSIIDSSNKNQEIKL